MVSVPLFDADGAVIGCKTTLTDITELKRAQEKLQFLSQASAILASSFDYRANLAKVAHAAVPVLADVCAIDLVDDAGQVSRLEMAFADPSKRDPAGSVPDDLAACRRGDGAGHG